MKRIIYCLFFMAVTVFCFAVYKGNFNLFQWDLHTREAMILFFVLVCISVFTEEKKIDKS